MSGENLSAGDESALPPPTGAPVQLPPPPKKPFYRKWWFWLIVVLAILTVVVGITGDGESTNSETVEVTEELEPATSKQEAVIDESADAESIRGIEPEATPMDVEMPTADSLNPADSDASDNSNAGEGESNTPSLGFELRARGDIADLAKDLDDMAIAAVDGGYFRLLGNSLELSFNIGQLQALTPPTDIAEDWNAGLTRVSKRVDAIDDSITNEGSTQLILERIESAAKALARLASVVDQIEEAATTADDGTDEVQTDDVVEVQLWNLGGNVYGKTSNLDAKSCKAYANSAVQPGDLAAVTAPSGELLGRATYSWILRDGPQRNYDGGADEAFIGYCTLTAKVPVLDSDIYIIEYMPGSSFEIARERLKDQDWLQTILF